MHACIHVWPWGMSVQNFFTHTRGLTFVYCKNYWNSYCVFICSAKVSVFVFISWKSVQHNEMTMFANWHHSTNPESKVNGWLVWKILYGTQRHESVCITDTKQCARKILRADHTEDVKPRMCINLLSPQLHVLPVHSDQIRIHSCTQCSLHNSPVLRIAVQVTNVTSTSWPNKTWSSQLPK